MTLTLYMIFNRRCNLNCSFCFQNPTGIKTGETTNKDNLAKFQDFVKKNEDIANITIMGGEAFLDAEALRGFLDFVRDLNRDRKKKLSITFITNGTIYLPWLKEYKDFIPNVQISLDGGPEAQNYYRKYLHTNEGSYMTVIENLHKYVNDGLAMSCHGILSWKTRKAFKRSFARLMIDLPKSVPFDGEIVHDNSRSVLKPLILMRSLYTLFNKYPDHRFKATRRPESPRIQSGNFCLAGTSFLAFDVNSGKFYGCHEEIGVSGEEVGSIHLENPIQGESLDKFVERRKYHNYKFQWLPRWLSHIILQSFPIFVCPTENKEIMGSPFIIPLKVVVIYFYGLTKGKKYLRRSYHASSHQG